MLALGLSPMSAVMAAEGGSSKLALAPVKAKKLPASVKSAIEKGDYADVQSALAGALKTMDISPKDATALHCSMMHELIRETGAEFLTAMAAESKDKAKFLQEFMKDTEWLELYLTCGLAPSVSSYMSRA